MDEFAFDGYRQLQLRDFPNASQAILLLERDVWWLKPFYLPFEKSYDGVGLLLYSRTNYWLAPTFCFLYLLFIWWGPRYMADKTPFKLQAPLKYWNLLLAVYSAWGASRVLPHMFVQLYKFGWNASLCSPPVFTYGRGAVGLWTGLFVYSKYFELIDTVFIVLRKRNLNFLHWYHHVTVLMYTWDAFASEQPPGMFYCGMNYAVHSVMYFYYYLAATRSRPPRWGVVVTLMQIAQMIAGVLITIVSLHNAFTKPFMQYSTATIAMDPADMGTCFISKTNMVSAAAMYSTYFYLFAKFFYVRYIQKKGGASKKHLKKRE
ncbi:GNS1/SUR4 family protein [Gregarina niphandrodes]|uniref:Elongation of fatty acids protein n=1 Tax=Gregarina niphandrodes TaxID=110365 RepID=A0A023B2X6_GRENI|nr:GNS1/SUR4 family protein [Gregarina niphandrodes]EZG55275.1 GNS1/SUR4 family protein [Gregarina niphandrodes]|eukprot:XP_011131654.1 GNS1/SUR4 family protein [Gregarina niphandrodes]